MALLEVEVPDMSTKGQMTMGQWMGMGRRFKRRKHLLWLGGRVSEAPAPTPDLSLDPELTDTIPSHRQADGQQFSWIRNFRINEWVLVSKSKVGSDWERYSRQTFDLYLYLYTQQHTNTYTYVHTYTYIQVSQRLTFIYKRTAAFSSYQLPPQSNC